MSASTYYQFDNAAMATPHQQQRQQYQQQQYHNQSSYNYTTPHGAYEPYKQPVVSVSPVTTSYTQPPQIQNYNASQATPSLRQQLSSLPMFPLRTQHESEARQKVLAQSAELLNQQQPEVELNMAQKVAMNLMTGGDFFNPRKLENNMLKVAAGSTAMLAVETATVVLTRWAVIPSNGSREVVLVDMLECRGKMKSNGVYLKVGSESEVVKLSLLGKSGVKVKPAKMWSKTWNFKPVESLAVEIDGREVQMEVLAKDQRGISPAEMNEMTQRFEFGWKVPRV